MTETLSLPAKPARPRFHELDGLRGWASVQVVLFHLVVATFAGLFPHWANPATAVLLNGHLAVCIFFILSGEALAIGSVAGGGRASGAAVMLKRYTRLTIPVAASCVVVLAISRAGLAHNIEAGGITRSPDWLAAFLSVRPSLASAVQFATAGVYMGIDNRTALNPFLWTMQFEMLGSILVLLAVLSWDHLKNRIALALLLFVILQPTELGAHVALFLVGMAFAWLRTEGWFATIQAQRGINFLSAVAILAICAADGVVAASKWPGSVRFDQFTAIALLLALFCNRTATAFLQSGLSRFLGYISFPLFLMQFPVVISLTSALIIQANTKGALDEIAAVVIAALSFLVCVIAALAFAPVETFTNWIGNWVVHFFQEKPAAVTGRTTPEAGIVRGVGR